MEIDFPEEGIGAWREILLLHFPLITADEMMTLIFMEIDFPEEGIGAWREILLLRLPLITAD